MFILKDPLYGRDLVYASTSEALVRAAMVARQLEIGFPSKQMVKWIDAHTEEWDGRSFMYWLPFGILDDGTIYLLPWARGAFGYFKAMHTMNLTQDEREAYSPPNPEDIDPALWTNGLLASIMEMQPEPRTQSCAEIMNEQTDPEQNPEIEHALAAIRAAQARNNVLTDPAKIRRRLAGRRSVTFRPGT